MLPHSSRQTHTVTQSPLSVTGTAALAVLELAITLPPPFPGPSEPQLSAPGTKDSVGEEEAKGARGVVCTQWLLGKACLAEWGDGRKMLEEEDEAGVGAETARASFRKVIWYSPKKLGLESKDLGPCPGPPTY